MIYLNTALAGFCLAAFMHELAANNFTFAFLYAILTMANLYLACKAD